MAITMKDQAKPTIEQTRPTPAPKMLAMNGTTLARVSMKPKMPFRPPITRNIPRILRIQSQI